MLKNNDLLLLLKSAELGDGEPDLGAKLMESFLKMLLESGSIPSRIICINSGVFLTTEGSQIIGSLKQFEALGSEILSCGTCLAYYKREDRLLIGKPTIMKDTVDSMLTFGKILVP